jgi:hypothetical protein
MLLEGVMEQSEDRTSLECTVLPGTESFLLQSAASIAICSGDAL